MTALAPEQGGYTCLQSQGQFERLHTEEIKTIQGMLTEDWKNLLRWWMKGRYNR